MIKLLSWNDTGLRVVVVFAANVKRVAFPGRHPKASLARVGLFTNESMELRSLNLCNWEGHAAEPTAQNKATL